MKKVLLLIAIAFVSGCSGNELYIKAGHRPVDEHQESQRTNNIPAKCRLWPFSADCSYRQAEGS